MASEDIDTPKPCRNTTPYERFSTRTLGPDEIFVPCNMPWSIAETWMRKFSEHHFREKNWWHGVEPHKVIDRSSIQINALEMLATWGKCRRDPTCTGVYFWIGDRDLEIWAEAYF